MPMLKANFERDKLESWIRELAAAVEDGDHARKKDLIDRLISFNSYQQDLNAAASQAVYDAAINNIASAVGKLRKVANGLSGARKALKRSLAAAESGQQELLIPRIAAVSQRMLDEIKILKAGVQDLISESDDINNLSELPGVLTNVLTELESALKKAKEISV